MTSILVEKKWQHFALWREFRKQIFRCNLILYHVSHTYSVLDELKDKGNVNTRIPTRYFELSHFWIYHRCTKVRIWVDTYVFLAKSACSRKTIIVTSNKLLELAKVKMFQLKINPSNANKKIVIIISNMKS